MSLIGDIKVKSLVTFQLLVDEQDVSNDFGVKSISIDRECNRIPTATMLIVDGNPAAQEYAASNADAFVPGANIHLLAGYQSANETVFKGIVTKHGIKAMDGVGYLFVECKDETFKLTLNKRNKIFYDLTESEVIEDIIKSNEIEYDVEATSFKHNELVQFCATDWDFIQARAQINNMLCFADDGKLTIQKPDLSVAADHKVTYGDNIFDFEAEIDARSQFKNFEASSWNYSDQEMVSKTAENLELNNAGNLASSTLADAAGGSDMTLNHGGKIADEILQSWVDGKSTYQQLNKISGTVKFQGDHTIKPGAMLTIEGMSDRFNGDVYVTAIHHEIAEGNWFTTAKFGLQPEWFAESFDISQLPAAGMLPAINGLQIGVVSALEGDPDEEHRIQVKLPVISPDEEGVWARVLSPHAGENYGMHFLPEIGDEVLLGFLNDDPNNAVVLGSLFSNANTSPIAYSDDNYEKVIMTKSEVKIAINDDKKIIALTSPAGKEIRMDEDEGVITLLDENSNIITMNSDGVSIESGKDIILKATGDVKIEGVNVELTASAAFKADASATAEVSSSATTTIKGGIVQIN